MRFNNFASRQSAFINTQLIGEAKQGNWMPTLRYVAAMPYAYSKLEPMMRSLQGKDLETDESKRFWNMIAVGGFAAVGDAQA